MRSISSIIVWPFIRAFKSLNKRKAVRDLKSKADKMNCSIPWIIKFPRKIEKKLYGQMEVFESPAGGKSDVTLLYLHGGAYCYQFSLFHWKFLAQMAAKTGCEVSVPNYPMLPQFTWKESFDMVMNFYQEFARTHDMSKVVIGGDSAGGGYALAVVQKAKELGLPLPAKMLLLSPWVDITGSDATMDKYDAMVNSSAALVFGEAWADGLDLKNPAVSPLYGNMSGLPETDLWIGTWEVLYKQNIELFEKMKNAGVNVTLHVGKKMGHVYPLYPIPEGRTARKNIAKFLSFIRH